MTSQIQTKAIGNSIITYAKIQNETALTLLGNPTGSSAAPSEITLGTGLSFSGSVLNSGGGSTPAATTTSAGTISAEGKWVSYTPTFSAGFGIVSAVTFFYKILGDSLFIRGWFTTGTVTSGVGTFTLPGSFTINTSSILNSGFTGIFGTSVRSGFNTGLAVYTANGTDIWTYDGSSTTTLQLTRDQNGSGNTFINHGVSGLLGSNEAQHLFMCEIPI